MQRIASIWLNRWETDRFFRAHRRSEAEGADAHIPFALTDSGTGGERLCALTSRAAALGLSEGNLLTDARALAPSLQTAPREIEAAREDLQNLARWCERYTPYAALDEPDGVFLDISGCGHLFGGERKMLEGIQARLNFFFLQSRIACADSAGAAWAAARYGDHPCIIIPERTQRETLASLPVSALRIDEETANRLYKLGLKRIGQLYDMPRAPLAARFGSSLLKRLNQALALEDEAISPLTPVCQYFARLALPEPICLLEHIELIARDLAAKLGPQLEAGGHGAKQFALKLFGTDGSLRIIAVNSARLLYRPRQIAALFHERIRALEASFDPGMGVDALALEASSIEALQYVQRGLDQEGQSGEELSFLLDRLAARLGPKAIARLDPIESHIPELAQQGVNLGKSASGSRLTQAPRPLLLLPTPEQVEVVAQIPDGPPAQFTWRRVRHRVSAADGPERISHEWWRNQSPITRDYFRVEDSEHRRYWLFREGLYGTETGSPRWFMHGVFA